MVGLVALMASHIAMVLEERMEAAVQVVAAVRAGLLAQCVSFGPVHHVNSQLHLQEIYNEPLH
jgi:hypothetical protein